MLCRAFALTFALWSSLASAQLDTDSRLLLGPAMSGDQPVDYDSGRYKMHAAPSARKTAPSAPVKSAEPGPSTPAETPGSPSASADASPTDATDEPNSQDQPVKVTVLPEASAPAAPLPLPLHKTSEGELGISLSLSPTYMFLNSESSFSPRRYSAQAPGLALGLEVWLTPTVGLKASYESSLSASVPDGPGGNSAFESQLLDAGVRVRRQFGVNQIAYGVDVHESRDKISRDSDTLIGHTSLGLSLSFEATLPSSNSYAHTFSVKLQPGLWTQEDSTDLTLRSGERPLTNALQTSFGGAWTFDKYDQVFWRGEVRVERTLYSGQATGADPQTGIVPDRVDATESTAILYFGFNWGS